MIFIYITLNNESEAREISRKILESKLSNCTNWFPITCMYSWEGKITEEQEVVLIVKTKKQYFEQIEKIVKEMKDKAAFIADGHHRYEAALRFKNELKMNNTKFTEEEEYNHIMMYFTSIEDKGLAIFPINRVIHNLAFFNPVEFLKSLEQFFDIEEFKASKKTVMAVRKKLAKDLEKAGQTKHAFGLYLGNNHYYLITLKDEKTVDEMVEEEKPKASPVDGLPSGVDPRASQPREVPEDVLKKILE